LYLDNVNFGNPYGTPQLLQRIKFFTNQVLEPRIMD
jgi:hypothetical protein